MGGQRGGDDEQPRHVAAPHIIIIPRVIVVVRIVICWAQRTTERWSAVSTPLDHHVQHDNNEERKSGASSSSHRAVLWLLSAVVHALRQREPREVLPTHKLCTRFFYY